MKNQNQCIEFIRRWSLLPKSGPKDLKLSSQPQEHTQIYPQTHLQILQKCIDTNAILPGQCVHGYLLKSGTSYPTLIFNRLIHMYAKCQKISCARQVFDEMTGYDTFSWSTMVSAYTKTGYMVDAHELVKQTPCKIAAISNAMISGYVKLGQFEEAMGIFMGMVREGIERTRFTFVSILIGCRDLGCVQLCNQIHAHVAKLGLGSNAFVGSALLDMYAKTGNLEFARHVFDEMSERDTVTWTSMIAGCEQNGHGVEGLKFFRRMLFEDVEPNEMTLAVVLSACSSVAGLRQGMMVHRYVVVLGSGCSLELSSALVAMYCKCGMVDSGRRIFDRISRRDVVCWNGMIRGYALNGRADEAIELFERMTRYASTRPNHGTFSGVLAACCHGGLVSKGKQYFERMKRDFGLEPEAEHYACLIDLLGKLGRLNEAVKIMENTPFEPDAGMWNALLSACRYHHGGNVELAEKAASRLFELEPQKGTPYVQLANIYAAACRWDDVRRIRKLMKDRGVTKSPGCSWIQVRNDVFAFTADDTKNNPQMQEIYDTLDALTTKIKALGYLPNRLFALQDLDNDGKDSSLCYHSEKLALAFGHLNVPHGMPLRIIKNLRICGDCHSAFRFISLAVKREITIRDTNRFHHFKDGFCSCGDFW